MNVPGLCVSLLVHMLILQSAHVHKVAVSCSVFLRVEPNKLQFFEYDPFTLYCEGVSGSTGLKLLRQSKENLPSCDTKTTTTSTLLSCNFPNLYPEESGEYWCESAEGERSNSLNISATAGSVILESPALPVKEGEAVTLRCRNKTNPSNPSADFYKNGLIFNHSSTGKTTIHSVSKCDKGFYKCKISGGGESAENWLEVEGNLDTSCKPCSPSPPPPPPPWIVIIVLLALLVVVGLLHLGKGYWRRAGFNSLPTLRLRPSAAQTVTVPAEEANKNREVYAVVSKKRKEENHAEASGALYYCLDDTADTQQPEAGVSNTATITVHSPGPNQPLTQDAFYSIIENVAE